MMPIGGRRPRRRRKQQQSVFSCFNIILSLVFVEVVVLLSLGFLSEDLAISHWASSVENFILDNLDPGNDDDLVQMEDLLARVAEDKLNNVKRPYPAADELVTEARFIATETTSLDDYYSRPHIPKTRPVPLVVGGSDGSGTRAFVDVLGRMGVPMLVDDSETMDIHADAMFGGQGWPPMASSVLRAMHSANYEFEALPQNVQNASTRELVKLDKRLQNRYTNLLHEAERKGSVVANGVTFGFKAPITMLLVPILHQFRGPMKFLHIVRDGRDIALSSNQSPVKKFYSDMYPDADRRKLGNANETKSIMAMQLWNDWNTQLLDWERKHADGTNFDYLVMRTEDLLDPETKYESLMQLAHFVGSPKTAEELCCMSRRAVVDMGHSALAGEQRFSKEQLKAYRERRGSGLARDSGLGEQQENPDFAKMTFEERMQALRERGEAREGTSDWVGEDGRRGQRREELQAKARDARYKNIMDRTAARLGAKIKQEKLAASPHLFEPKPGGKDRRRLTSAQLRNRPALDADETLADMKFADADEKFSTMAKLTTEKGENTMLEARARFRGARFGKHMVGDLVTKSLGRAEKAPRLRPGLEQPPVQKRYGKWVDLLKDRPELSRKLYQEGKRGLASFGYEPHARFMDFRKDKTGFQCDDTVVCGLGVGRREETTKEPPLGKVRAALRKMMLD